jgi:hypothetical protein
MESEIGDVVSVLHCETLHEYVGVEAKLHAVITSTLSIGAWSASRSGRLSPEETALGRHWIGRIRAGRLI